MEDQFYSPVVGRVMVRFNGELAKRIEAKAIADAHPMKTGRHDLYEEALRLVGERESKVELVNLVNWLLHRLSSEQHTEVCNESPNFQGTPSPRSQDRDGN